MDLLRHAGMGRVFTAGRAPSTLGTFLRAFTFGHARQLDAVASRVLVNLAGRAPLLVGADQVAYLDIDDTIKATYGYQKQGAGYGYSKVKGLNALLATCSTPRSVPVIAAAKAGATGQVTVRCDSAYYNHDVIAAARTGGARFSITACMDPAVTRAITEIPDDAWVGIKYPHAIYDEQEQRWVSDVEVAEIGFTAFTWRHHAVFTDSQEPMLAAEATTATIRAQLIAVPARIARSARRLRLHLPER